MTVPAPDAAFQSDAVFALLQRLLHSQMWSTAKMRLLQDHYAQRLLAHAHDTVPYYAARGREGPAAAAWPQPGSAAWQTLPLLSRDAVLRHGAQLHAHTLGPEHGGTHVLQTSGSTGQPVSVVRTDVNRLWWSAITLREHCWHRRDAAASVAVIRLGGSEAPESVAPGPDGRRFDDWGAPFNRIWRCGPAFALDMRTDVAVQAQWLQRMQPRYLVTYPTNLGALLELLAKGHSLALEQVCCIGETVSDALRRRCAEVLKCAIVANYSSQEMGTMAVQCRFCDQYHVQAESVMLEVLDDQDRPCSEGAVGRIVVTDLHNFAMPLIRYEIGDYAEVGGVCKGGITLPSLRRILGRRRNMLVHADGRRHWPVTGFWLFREVAPVTQYQFIQHSVSDIEVRLVADVPLVADQLAGLARLIQRVLGPGFELRLQQWPGPLPGSRGGKFEEFVSLVRD